MKDEQLLRYSRQIMLPQMDVAGQQKLIDATVLIVGMGGLGCPAAMYLAAAGVGHLIIADDDLVELTNLQRQVAHSQSMIGEPKVVSAQQTLLGLNPDLKITAHGDDENACCSENGVMAPLVGIIGAVQAMEAIKLLTGIGESLTGRLLLLDASTLQWREMRLPRDSSCGACGV